MTFLKWLNRFRQHKKMVIDMKNWIAYICEACITLDKVKPNLMNFITKAWVLISLLIVTTSITFAQPCSSPNNVYIETTAFNSINVSWDAVQNGTSYEVEYENIETSDSETVTSNNNSITISNIQGGTYEIEVTTYCESGSISVSFAIIQVVVDNLEDIEGMCHNCYQKFKECEAKNGFENCDCTQLCGNVDCCDFVTNEIVVITPPTTKQCDCEVLCNKSDCCEYINDDKTAMPFNCEACANAVRECNKATKMKSNKTTLPLIEKEGCQIDSTHPNPFRDELQLSFELQYDATVVFTIYDTKGQEVNRLINNEKQEKGKHEYRLKTGDWNKGVYYSILETKEGCKTVQKMLKIE
ncbi:MAG: T9SS type A sorting domain-containing protein [Chitinophagales bacterium]